MYTYFFKLGGKICMESYHFISHLAKTVCRIILNELKFKRIDFANLKSMNKTQINTYLITKISSLKCTNSINTSVH